MKVLIKTTATTNIQNAGFFRISMACAYSCNASGILAYGFEFHGRGNSRLWTSLFWEYILLGHKLIPKVNPQMAQNQRNGWMTQNVASTCPILQSEVNGASPHVTKGNLMIPRYSRPDMVQIWSPNQNSAFGTRLKPMPAMRWRPWRDPARKRRCGLESKRR